MANTDTLIVLLIKTYNSWELRVLFVCLKQETWEGYIIQGLTELRFKIISQPCE